MHDSGYRGVALTVRKVRASLQKGEAHSLEVELVALLAIASQLFHLPAQLLRVEEGSLYPALHRLEQEGWVRAEWGKTEKNREARFYSLPAALPCDRRRGSPSRCGASS